MGSDPPIRAKMTTSHIFQSTLPHGVRPIVTIEMVKQFSISIHAPAWGATKEHTIISEIITISIHAPRMGSDDYAEAIRLGIVNISIHAPRMGSDRLTPLR